MVLSLPELSTDYDDLDSGDKFKMQDYARMNGGGPIAKDWSYKQYHLTMTFTFNIPKSRGSKARLVSQKARVEESLHVAFPEDAPITIDGPISTLSASGRHACQKILAKFPEWEEDLPSLKFPPSSRYR